MIFAKVTPNYTGIAIYGDFLDFENLYEALHTVVGTEEDYVSYESARIRVLGVCYDIRHALMGDREFEFVDNGMDEDMKRRMSVLAPEKNVYLKIYVLLPEMLFVTIALNEFLELHAQKLAKTKYSHNMFTEAKVVWDAAISQVRLLQAAVAECLKDTVSKGVYARILNNLNSRHLSVEGYISHYIDILNDKFMNMNSEKRLKSISTFAKRIVEHDEEYIVLRYDLRKEAKKRNCGVNDLRLNIDFPEYIEW